MKYYSLFFLVLFFSCGDDSSNCSEQILSGRIDGIEFELGFGTALISNGQTNFQFYPTGESFGSEPCFFGGSSISAFGAVDLGNVGRTDFSPTTSTFTLFNPDGFLNIIIVDGYLEITSRSDSEISGNLRAEFDEENNLCGTFTATICN